MSAEITPHPLADSPVLRANVFHVLARAYSPPDTWPDGFDELVHCTFEPLGPALAEAGGKLANQVRHSSNASDRLAAAHARLFIGPFDIQAPPWASLYLDPDKQLMGESSRYAAAAYAHAGLGPVDGPKDAPDHITHELEYMYFLAFQENKTGETVWLEQQARFWREHLGKWLPQLAELMREAEGAEPLYLSLADLTTSLCGTLEESGIYRQ